MNHRIKAIETLKGKKREKVKLHGMIIRRMTDNGKQTREKEMVYLSDQTNLNTWVSGIMIESMEEASLSTQMAPFYLGTGPMIGSTGLPGSRKKEQQILSWLFTEMT